AIRDAMADRPRRVLLRSDDDRRLATGLLGLDQVVAVELADGGVTISTGNAGELALALPRLSRQLDVRLREVRALDASLDSVFADLTSRWAPPPPSAPPGLPCAGCRRSSPTCRVRACRRAASPCSPCPAPRSWPAACSPGCWT